MRSFFVALAVVALATSAAAVAQNNDVKPAPVSTPKNAKVKSGVVCQKEAETGSRLGAKRVCHTQEEWSAIKAEERQSLERTQALRYNGNQ